MSTIIYDPVPITVTYEELEGSPDEQFRGGVFKATRSLKCAWADRFLMASQMGGSSKYEGGNLWIWKPQTYPAYSYAKVVGVRMQPFFDKAVEDGSSTSEASYPDALITVEYSSPEVISTSTGGPSDPDDAEVEETLEPTTEFLTIPGQQMAWSDGEMLKDAEAPGLMIKGMNWVYRKKNMLYVPAVTSTLVGKVNQAAVTAVTLGITFAAETLLYSPPLLRRTTATSGWDLEYRFSFKENGWNKFFRASSGAYENIYRGGTIFKPFTPSPDFTKLVR